MRRRYQAGSVTESGDGRYWLGKYRDPDKKQRTKLLGKVGEMTKSEARELFAKMLRPVNAAVENVGPTVSRFLEDVFFPVLTRTWKASTAGTNRYRISKEIGGAVGDRLMATLTREELQGLIDSKMALSYSTVAHLRWDLKQMFDLAMAEGLVMKNPALMLFVPKACRKPNRRVMEADDVRTVIQSLELRERLVFKLGTVAGLRPGEIFGLRRRLVVDQVIDVQERLYRGRMDTPKTERSVRSIAIAETLQQDIDAWLPQCPDTGQDAWLFPSERLVTPVSKDNFVNRHLRPALRMIGMEWVTFQVMRRTHASLMRNLGVDPKIVADLMGHDISTNLNVYTQTSMEARQAAAKTLGSALVN